MILTNLRRYFEQHDFTRIQVNVSWIYIYYTVVTESIYAVMLVDFDNGLEFTKEEYHKIKNQIVWNFLGKGYSDINLLGILLGLNIGQMWEICGQDDLNWIVDTETDRLILYENQTTDFLGLKSVVESILSGDTSSISIVTGNKSIKWYAYFGLCNTLIVLANIIVFILTEKGIRESGSVYLLDHGALFGRLVIDGEYYRLITCMFLHGGIDHIVNNMLILLFIGDNLERSIGKVKYLIIYFISGILAGVASISYNMAKGVNVVSVGASGAIFGVIGALAYIVAINKGRLEDINKRQMLLFVALSLYGGFINRGVDNAAHIGGLIAGVLIAVLLYRKPKIKD